MSNRSNRRRSAPTGWIHYGDQPDTYLGRLRANEFANRWGGIIVRRGAMLSIYIPPMVAS
jgi:hypothetical protein